MSTVGCVDPFRVVLSTLTAGRKADGQRAICSGASMRTAEKQSIALIAMLHSSVKSQVADVFHSAGRRVCCRYTTSLDDGVNLLADCHPLTAAQRDRLSAQSDGLSELTKQITLHISCLLDNEVETDNMENLYQPISEQVRQSSGTDVYPHMPILRPHAVRFHERHLSSAEFGPRDH